MILFKKYYIILIWTLLRNSSSRKTNIELDSVENYIVKLHIYIYKKNSLYSVIDPFVLNWKLHRS